MLIWQHKKWRALTKKQREHVKVDAGCRTLEQLAHTIRWQRCYEDKHGEVPCWDCKDIARVLEIPEESHV